MEYSRSSYLTLPVVNVVNGNFNGGITSDFSHQNVLHPFHPNICSVPKPSLCPEENLEGSQTAHPFEEPARVRNNY